MEERPSRRSGGRPTYAAAGGTPVCMPRRVGHSAACGRGGLVWDKLKTLLTTELSACSGGDRDGNKGVAGVST